MLALESIQRALSSSLGRKGIVIVVIPLAFSVLFVLMLRYFFHEASTAADREARSKEIIFKANNFGAEMLQVGTAYYMARFGGSKDTFRLKVAKIRKDFAELESLVPQDSNRGRLLKKTRQNLEQLYEVLTTRWELKYRNAELFQSEDVAGLKTSLQELMATTVKDMNAVALEESLERKKHPMTFEKYRTWIDAMLLGGLVTNVIIAIVLVAYFSNGITRRILIVEDNSKRFAEGDKLHAPVAGKDEIAALDRVFHEMVEKLTKSRDIEREYMETIKLSESRLRSIIDTIPLGLVVMNENREITMLSPAAENLFGVSSTSASGTGVESLLPGLPQEVPTRVTCELQARHQEGRPFPAEVLGTEYNTIDMRGRLLIVTDITQKYEIEKLKQSFVAMVSHELRSPLMSIQVCMKMMLEGFFGELNQEGTAAAALAEKSTIRLIGLVNEILDVERIGSGNIHIAPEAIKLQDVVDLSIDSVVSLARNKQVEIVKTETTEFIYADKNRIVQVLVNLLTNAIKFSDPASRIELKVESGPQLVHICVKDFGRGIPETQQELIFERFYQVAKADATEKGGTGLGLAICKAIVLAHGGQISVESDGHTGSTFRFSVPRATDEQQDT